MFKNLFKSLTQKFSTPTAPDAPIAVVMEGERRLEDAQKQLAELEEKYFDGELEDQSDEMWEAITDYESVVETLLRAQKRGWVPSKKVIKDIRTDIAKQRRWMVKNSYPQNIIDDELEWRQQYLEDAVQGLR